MIWGGTQEFKLSSIDKLFKVVEIGQVNHRALEVYWHQHGTKYKQFDYSEPK